MSLTRYTNPTDIAVADRTKETTIRLFASAIRIIGFEEFPRFGQGDGDPC